jgi:hypothetical protein
MLFSQKKKEILPFATVWMNLEDIVLSKMRQAQKDAPCLLIYGTEKVKLNTGECTKLVSRNLYVGEKRGEMLVKEYKFSIM